MSHAPSQALSLCLHRASLGLTSLQRLLPPLLLKPVTRHRGSHMIPPLSRNVVASLIMRSVVMGVVSMSLSSSSVCTLAHFSRLFLHQQQQHPRRVDLSESSSSWTSSRRTQGNHVLLPRQHQPWWTPRWLAGCTSGYDRAGRTRHGGGRISLD